MNTLKSSVGENKGELLSLRIDKLYFTFFFKMKVSVGRIDKNSCLTHGNSGK